jgi:hypothetical protein
MRHFADEGRPDVAHASPFGDLPPLFVAAGLLSEGREIEDLDRHAGSVSPRARLDI